MKLDRRNFIKFAGGGLACAILGGCKGSVFKAKSSQRPNIVLILTDDQGWNGTSALMHPERKDAKSDYYETPNLKRFANESMRFSQGYAPAPICTPTRRSIQYGMTPARQKGTQFSSPFKPEDHLSIPQMLKSIDDSYAAAHFGKWGSRMGAHPEAIGYDASDGKTRNPVGGYDYKNKHHFSTYTLNDDPKRIFSVTGRAVNFMQNQVHANRPFYLQISHYAVHTDLEARKETFEKYQDKAPGKIHHNAAFAAMTEDLDTGIGKVLDKIEALEIEDDTYIFLMADNGGVPRMPLNFSKRMAPPDPNDPFSNHPLRGGKWTLFEGGIRVPFMVKGPGIKANTFCDEPVVGWDLLPTFYELAGGDTGKLPMGLDGRSFAKLLKNEGKGRVKRDFDGLVFHAPFKYPGHSAIRAGDYKLVKLYQPKEKLLLFNIKKDLNESEDLSEAMPEKTQELHNKLMNYLKRVDARMFEKTM